MDNSAAKYITQSNLSVRNSHWTSAAIVRLLGAPDDYGNGRYQTVSYLYLLTRVEAAEATDGWKEHCRKLDLRRNPECKELRLLTAIQEASRAAHRWREAATKQYSAGNYGLAGRAKRQKLYLYGLKERGIIAGYKIGELRYAGVAPQGMAVYEYGDGGMQCFHSTLHPAGAERILVEAHPEVLFVPATAAMHLLRDAEYTLQSLPSPGPDFERSARPVYPRPPAVWFRLGPESEFAQECGEM